MRRLALAHLHLVVAEMFVSGCAISHEPQLVTVPQPGLRPVTSLDQVFDYRTAAATVAWIFEHDFGFPSFPATFRFYPNREAFEQALLDVGYDPDLARSAAKTMTAVGGHRSVLLNNAMLGSLPWADRVALLAHEFGHSLQYRAWRRAARHFRPVAARRVRGLAVDSSARAARDRDDGERAA